MKRISEQEIAMVRTVWISVLALGVIAPALTAQTPVVPPVSEQIVVSATKLPEREADIPADTTVITGAELRARGAQTLSDALASAPGVEAFDGCDQGAILPNIALWGLKEFDAYLVEVNGVPVGGAYAPDLQQIDVRNIDRIEIVRGPAGVVHGSTAFAGVISIYAAQAAASHIEVAAGSFGTRDAHFATGSTTAAGTWGVQASAMRTDGWRPRTAGRRDEIDWSWISGRFFGGSMSARLFALDRGEDFGAPLPIDSVTGLLPDGISDGSNLALRGARVASQDIGLSSRYERSVGSIARLTNILGYTHRNGRLARSFVDKVEEGGEVEGAGTEFRPRNDDMFEDLRFDLTLPQHHLLLGVSANYGSLTSAGRKFDLAYTLGGPIPSVSDIPDGTAIRVSDHRLFAGVYAEDEWSPTARLTATGGLRYDRDSERRGFDSDEERSRQSRADGAASGRAALMFHLLTAPAESLDVANVYLAANRTFKPAAFDPAPGEDEGLLAPERSRSLEGGIKIGGAKQRWSAELTAFDMRFRNMVVAANVDGNPTRVNAGETRFRGVDVAANLHPVRDVTFRAGLGFHDPRFIRFTAVDEEGKEEVEDGHMPELVARRLWTIAAIYAPEHFAGGSLTVRGAGKRALDRDNVFFTRPYTVVDASVYVPVGRTRLEVVGRNLTNRRFVTTDSDLQDGLRYVSAPRSVVGRVSVSF